LIYIFEFASAKKSMHMSKM